MFIDFWQVVETEASREALRKELANVQRKMAELVDESRMKEKDYQMALEDSRRAERKLEDSRRNLEINLENSNAEGAELKLRLSGAEGRVNALEAQLARLEGTKQDIEFKLSSIVSSLRRTIGFRQEMPRARSPIRSRTPSPRRSRPTSPAKGEVINIYIHILFSHYTSVKVMPLSFRATVGIYYFVRNSVPLTYKL